MLHGSLTLEPRYTRRTCSVASRPARNGELVRTVPCFAGFRGVGSRRVDLPFQLDFRTQPDVSHLKLWLPIYPPKLLHRLQRYLFGHDGDQIAESGEVESGKRSNRPLLTAAMTLAKRRKATLLVSRLDRLCRSVAFIYPLMDSKGFDLAILTCRGPTG
jgi:hypothetical protein